MLENAQLRNFLDAQDKAENKERDRQKTGKTDGSATGLLWKLSALALAACGGGGGGSPAPQTGGNVQATTPVKGAKEPQTSDADFLANILLSDAEKPSDKIAKAASQALETGAETPIAYGEVDRDNLTNGGFFSIENHKIQTDKMISVQVGGVVDPLTGVQISGGGVDKDDVYQGPVWYSLPGSLLITPITDYIAREFALEQARIKEAGGDLTAAIDKQQIYQQVIDKLFNNSADDKETDITLDDVLDGGAGADIFVLDKSDSGTDIITDFSVSDGDKIRIDTANGSNDDTIAELNRAGYYIRGNGTDTTITNADNSHIYLTLNNIDHNDITDSSFDSYFEII